MAKESRSAGTELRISDDRIERRIHLIRNVRVILSGDLAELYGVPTRQLVFDAIRELTDEDEFVVCPRLADHGPTLFAWLSKHLDLRLVNRLEFGSGAVAMRYEPRR